MGPLLAFAASTRTGSWNRRLLGRIVEGAEAAGAKVTLLDLKAFPLPLYDGDLEAASGLPPPATQLRELLRAHAGFLIATPEYNGGMPPLLVNVLAWTSRPVGKDPPGAVFRGKPVGLASASPAPTGGMRVLGQAGQILGNLGAVIIPFAIGVSDASKAFGSGSQLQDGGLDKRVLAVGAGVARFLAVTAVAS